jgi:hypothetical protein
MQNTPPGIHWQAFSANTEPSAKIHWPKRLRVEGNGDQRSDVSHFYLCASAVNSAACAAGRGAAARRRDQFHLVVNRFQSLKKSATPFECG